jgi:hypothetical protein
MKSSLAARPIVMMCSRGTSRCTSDRQRMSFERGDGLGERGDRLIEDNALLGTDGKHARH